MTVFLVLAGMPDVAPPLSEFRPGVDAALLVLDGSEVLVDVTRLVNVECVAGGSDVGGCEVGGCEVVGGGVELGTLLLVVVEVVVEVVVDVGGEVVVVEDDGGTDVLELVGGVVDGGVVEEVEGDEGLSPVLVLLPVPPVPSSLLSLPEGPRPSTSARRP